MPTNQKTFSKTIQLPRWLLVPIAGIMFISILANAFLVNRLAQGPTVVRVPDGDSLDLSDGRRVRLLAIDAPEVDRCMASQARDELVQLTINKKVRLADTITDDYGRMLANVYIGSTLVNDTLVAKGLAKFISVRSPEFDRLKASSTQAKAEKLGIYSDICRSKDPTTDCQIKGNTRAGKKTYYLPNCTQYTNVIVDQSFGDAWFCREADAQKAGFSRSPTCPEG